MTESAKPAQPKTENPWLNLIFNIVLPTLILMKLSDEARLGPEKALILGCALPIGYGVYDYIKNRKINFFSILGLIAVLVKGVFGLFKLPPLAFACSEAALPLIFGAAILYTTRWNPPLVQRFLLSPQLFDIDRIKMHLEEEGNEDKLRPLMVTASYGYAGTMVLSAILNFGLAITVLKAEPGTPEFVAEIGKFTGLQYPVISVPLMIVTFGLLYYILKRLGQLTGVSAMHLVHGTEDPEEEPETPDEKKKESQEA